LRTTLLVIAVLLGILALAGIIAYASWRQLADVTMSFHGYVALGLGIGLTILLWVGLMSLVFLSSRRGYDDEAGRD
jgi:hypothetical protein